MALDSFGQGGKVLLILLMYGSCQKLVTKLCTYSVYVELKKKRFVLQPSGPSCWSFSWFLQHEVTRSIAITPLFPGWDATTFARLPPLKHFARLP